MAETSLPRFPGTLAGELADIEFTIVCRVPREGVTRDDAPGG